MPSSTPSVENIDLSYAGLPSQFNIALITSELPTALPINSLLNEIDLDFLSSKFRVYYQFAGVMGSPESVDQEYTESNTAEAILRIENLGVEQTDLLINLQDDVMKDSKALMSSSERSEVKPILAEYLRIATHRLVYYHEGIPVAGLYANDNLYHSLFREHVIHVGFLGILRRFQDRPIREEIRKDFRQKLENISRGRNVVGKIAAINNPAIANAIRMGRKPMMLILDKRSSLEKENPECTL